MTNVTKFPNLAKDLRKWGLRVVEVKGWQTRSSNWSKSFDPHGIVVHHTAGPNSGNAPSLGYIKAGNSSAPGPLAQFLLARDGTVYLLGGHRANHAGLGGPFRSIPKDSANAYMWGIEAENNGRGERWNEVQLNAYYRLCAALLATTVKSKDVNYVIGHKEWAPGRKFDPAGIKMSQFRQRVKQALDAGPSPKPKPKPQPTPTKGTHKVVVGDTLWGLANKWRTTVDKIKGANNIKSDVLAVGQVLKRPVGKPKKPVDLKRVAVVDLSKLLGDIASNAKKSNYVYTVAKALKAEGYKGMAMNGAWGSGKTRAYSKWQKSKAGGEYTGKDANGIPGMDSLTRLGKKHGFKVVA